MTTRWLIDFDSVLSNTFKHQIERLNERFDLSLTHEDFTSWDTSKFLTEEQADYMWGNEVFLNPQFQLECSAVPYGIFVVRLLVSIGDECVVVSDRPRELYDVTRLWLDQHELRIPLFLTRSHISKSDQDASIPTKQDVVRLLGLTKAVDDAPHHATAFRDMPEMGRVYLMDTPSNQDVVETPKITRVRSWFDVYEHECVVPLYVTEVRL